MDFSERLLGSGESKVSRVCGIIVNCVLVLVVLSLVAVLIVTNTFALCEVDGTSMNPTLQDGQYVLVEKHRSAVSRGDVIVLKKQGMSVQLIKRVVAVGGDSFEFVTDGADVTLEVGGSAVENDFAMSSSIWSRYFSRMEFALNTEYTVPEGKLLVLGDNRNNSTDSRFSEVGFVDCQTELVGRADVFITPDSFWEWFAELIYGASARQNAQEAI